LGDLTVTAGTLDFDGFNASIHGLFTLDDEANAIDSEITMYSGLDFSGAIDLAVNAWTSFIFSGPGTLIPGAINLPACHFNSNCSFIGSFNVSRIVFSTDNVQLTFEAGETATIANLAAADWNGAAPDLYNRFRSSNSPNEFFLDIPNAINAEWCFPRDCTLVGFDVTVTNSVNGGNNTGWIFPPALTSTFSSFRYW
jgi:hypothetical protein